MIYNDYITGNWDPRYLVEEIADYFNDSEYSTQYIKCRDGTEQRGIINLIQCRAIGKGYNFILGFDPYDFYDRDWKYIYHDNLSREIHIASRCYRHEDEEVIDLESLIDNACIRELEARGKPDHSEELTPLDIDDLFYALPV